MGIYDKFLNEEDLDEHAIAMSGDYNFGNLNYIDHNGMHILSKEVTEELTNFEFKNEILFIVKYKPKNGLYLLTKEYVEPQTTENGKVYDYKTRWYVLGAIFLTPLSKLKKLGYSKKVYEVKGVEINQNNQGQGYGKALYKNLILKLNFILVGDQEQYDGARKLWVSLSNNPDFKVDIIDIEHRIIIEKDVNLKDVFDERIWVKHQELINKTLNQEKDTVGKFHRLVLTKVE